MTKYYKVQFQVNTLAVHYSATLLIQVTVSGHEIHNWYCVNLTRERVWICDTLYCTITTTPYYQ